MDLERPKIQSSQIQMKSMPLLGLVVPIPIVYIYIFSENGLCMVKLSRFEVHVKLEKNQSQSQQSVLLMSVVCQQDRWQITST
jgi:hypothetical protein